MQKRHNNTLRTWFVELLQGKQSDRLFNPGYRDSRRVEFAFKKLADEDNRLAVFRLFDEDDQYDEMLSTRLKASLAIRSPGYWPNPPQLVYFKQIVNDTELPSFRIKYSPEIEISCDWRGLLTALLKEEKLVNRESVSVRNCSSVS